MIHHTPIAIHWFRRDLRLDDNAALFHVLKSGLPVLPLFIFDTNILSKLQDRTDKRVQFIHQELSHLQQELSQYGSSVQIEIGTPSEVWERLTKQYAVRSVFTNHDYEPYATARDTEVSKILQQKGIDFFTFKDHVIFERAEVVKNDGSPYTVFTPYSKKWKAKLNRFYSKSYPTLKYASAFFKTAPFSIPTLETLGFEKSDFDYPPKVIVHAVIKNYATNRNFPALNSTSRLGIHLRFGTLSIRKLLQYALTRSEVYVNELIWRDFYTQILFHFPYVTHGAFKQQYDQIEWQNNEAHFKAWCLGQTGFPLVDAGMRELNETGFMHNRVRMVVASFLTKHLLIDWKWGEAYFAEKLLDFDLASNNGGWQWAAGCGTDAAPYFRVFNPQLQLEKFDPDLVYVKKWVPEFGTDQYAAPIVDHKAVKDKVMAAYGKALKR